MKLWKKKVESANIFQEKNRGIINFSLQADIIKTKNPQIEITINITMIQVIVNSNLKKGIIFLKSNKKERRKFYVEQSSKSILSSIFYS